LPANKQPSISVSASSSNETSTPTALFEKRALFEKKINAESPSSSSPTKVTHEGKIGMIILLFILLSMKSIINILFMLSVLLATTETSHRERVNKLDAEFNRDIPKSPPMLLEFNGSTHIRARLHALVACLLTDLLKRKVSPKESIVAEKLSLLRDYFKEVCVYMVRYLAKQKICTYRKL
jgi:hypothetical protein